MGNACTAPSCGKRIRNCCSRYICCDCCPCNCCKEPKFGRTADNSVVTLSPISMGLVVAPTDETDHCKFLFWLSMSHKFIETHQFIFLLLWVCQQSNIKFHLYVIQMNAFVFFQFLFYEKSKLQYWLFILCTWVGGQEWSLRKSHMNNNKIKVTLIALLHWKR